MVAVVYSGSKSAFWKIEHEGKIVAETATVGINPCFNDAKQINQLLNKNIHLIHQAENIKKIYVFAAGAASTEKQIALAQALKQFFINSKIKVKDDVHGAALAACDDKCGIVGILGSGANCAYYNGKKPKPNNYGLGYILGDEGSANYLGRMLLKDYLEENLPDDLRQKAKEKYGLERANILERIYRRPNAQSYLSSFLDFFIENREHKYVQKVVDQGFDAYISTYIVPLTKQHPNQDVHFVGSVAGLFPDRLRAAAQRQQIEIISIIKEPLHNILNYYIN